MIYGFATSMYLSVKSKPNIPIAEGLPNFYRFIYTIIIKITKKSVIQTVEMQ